MPGTTKKTRSAAFTQSILRALGREDLTATELARRLRCERVRLSKRLNAMLEREQVLVVRLDYSRGRNPARVFAAAATPPRFDDRALVAAIGPRPPLLEPYQKQQRQPRQLALRRV